MPVLKNNPELEQCISANDNNPTVNLTNAEINISETTNATFEYFPILFHFIILINLNNFLDINFYIEVDKDLLKI